jgi:hypothetical protein
MKSSSFMFKSREFLLGIRLELGMLLMVLAASGYFIIATAEADFRSPEFTAGKKLASRTSERRLRSQQDLIRDLREELKAYYRQATDPAAGAAKPNLFAIAWKVADAPLAPVELLAPITECTTYETAGGTVCADLVKAIATANEALGEQAALKLLEKTKSTGASIKERKKACVLVANVALHEQSLAILKGMGAPCFHAYHEAKITLELRSEPILTEKFGTNIALTF